MFTKLHLENFLSFKGPLDVPLQPLTVVVGANNSGKSNLLSAFRFLCSLASEPVTGLGREHLGRSLPSVVFRGSDTCFGIAADAASDSRLSWHNVRYDLRINTASAKFEYERLKGSAKGVSGEAKHAASTNQKSILNRSDGYVVSFRKYLASVRYFHFNPNSLRAPSAITASPALQSDGTGLAAILDHLRDEFPAAYKKIETDFKMCVPEVEEIRLRKIGAGQKTVLLKERGFVEPFSAGEISDGVLLLLALLCCINMQPRPSLILLEEPEHGVHPRRLKDIVDLLGSLTEQRGSEPPVQILLTTHSPYLLDQFKDELDAVLVCEKTDHGTTVKPARDLIEKMGGMHGSPLGELWYSGVLGGVPA